MKSIKNKRKYAKIVSGIQDPFDVFAFFTGRKWRAI